jgi:predicted nucleotidyltransferase component of viral defense system
MVKNIAASVKHRLLNLSRNTGDDFNQLLDRYTRERFLYRLSRSSFCNNFILKGASVFEVWQGNPHRPTKDIDLLGFGSNSPEQLKSDFEKICQIECDDGIEFEKISTDILQKGQKYEGVRLNIEGKLGTAKLFLQVDIGFGHIVTPPARNEEFPTLLKQPAPNLRVYPPETVIAEKLQAMIVNGVNNSRIKDYYDCLFLARNFEFDGEVLKQAIKATFQHRQTPISTQVPFGLTDEFVTLQPSRNNQWQKIVASCTTKSEISLQQAIGSIREFLMPPLQAAAEDRSFSYQWSPDRQWQSRSTKP